MVEQLENNLKNFGTLSVTSGFADNFNAPGDGAAGGLGFALRNYLHAESSSGAELVLDLLDFDNTISDAALVITGEGCSDRQTALSKLPAVVAEHARRKNVPVILLSGALGKGSEKLAPLFCAVLFSSYPFYLPLSRAKDDFMAFQYCKRPKRLFFAVGQKNRERFALPKDFQSTTTVPSSFTVMLIPSFT